MAIRQLGYLVFESANIADWRPFATEVLGLAAWDSPNGELYLKADGRAFRLLIVPGDQDRLLYSGWEVPSEAEFEALKAKLMQAGVEVIVPDASAIAQRHVTGLFRLTDPSGNVIEVYWGPISDFKRFVSPIGVKSFITGDMGMGHVVLPAINFDETCMFWTNHLGMGLSDILRIPKLGPDGSDARVHFYHCNPRQHSLALGEVAVPSGCIHLMLEVPDIDEVGLALDRCREHNVPLAGTLGRHVNDDMVSFYLWTPGGFQIEFGCGGAIKDWEKENTVFETTRGSHWGHEWLPRPAM